MFSKEIKEQLSKVLSKMKNNVNIIYFTQEYECSVCKDTKEFVTEFSQMSDKIKLEVKDFVKDDKLREKYNVDKVPAIIILDKDGIDYGIKYYGPPAGYEINSFIVTLIEMSGIVEDYSDDIEKQIKNIDKDIHIQVFVSLQCPYCPPAVITAHKLAQKNNKIKADMIESSVFPHLANKYSVNGVPKIIINEKYSLEGAQPVEEFLKLIKKI
ncbi:MAG: glutaredoxin [Fusobacteria bacterium]|nr:glutaredoxin [Fusobacteriota bacterium]